MAFQVLVVCTGNVCRSPMAEMLLRARVGSIEGIETTSAGTDALVGAAMTAQAANLALGLGVPATEVVAHRARQLEPWMLRDADLVMALTRDQRGAILSLEPSITRRTFTLRELAHVTASMPTPHSAERDQLARLRSAVAAAVALRGVVSPLVRSEDADVIDPYLQSDSVYERSAAQLAPAAESVGRFLVRVAGVPS